MLPSQYQSSNMSLTNTHILDDKEKSLAAIDIDGGIDPEHDDPEYAEYLALMDEYTGDKLKKLTVSRMVQSSIAMIADFLAQDRLESRSPAHFHIHALLCRPSKRWQCPAFWSPRGHW
jgi:hypothetical protein